MYDPYFCAGSVRKRLAVHGFKSVYNRREDFYAVRFAPFRAARSRHARPVATPPVEARVPPCAAASVR